MRDQKLDSIILEKIASESIPVLAVDAFDTRFRAFPRMVQIKVEIPSGGQGFLDLRKKLEELPAVSSGPIYSGETFATYFGEMDSDKHVPEVVQIIY